MILVTVASQHILKSSHILEKDQFLKVVAGCFYNKAINKGAVVSEL